MSYQVRSILQWLDTDSSNPVPVFWFKDQFISVQDLRGEVVELHHHLLTLSAKRVALYFEDHYSFVISLLACLYAKKIPVLLSQTKLSRIAIESQHYDLLLSEHTIDQDIDGEVFQPREPLQPVSGDLPALSLQQTIELFTSGSSGHPKKVVKTLQQMDDESRLIAPLLHSRLADSCLLTTVNPCHLYGLTFTVWLPFSLGIPVNRKRVIFPEEFSAHVTNRCYTLITSPAFLKRIDETLSPPPTSLVLSAGGPLDLPVTTKINAWLGVGVDEIYGSTETGVMAHRYRETIERPWRCLPDVRFTPIEDHWLLKSPLVTEVTGLALSDALTFVDDDCFHLAGRLSRLIKLEEKRISLDEIERQVLALEGIIDAAVMTITQRGRKRIAALVVMSAEQEQQWRLNRIATERLWRKTLGIYLEDIAIPRYWRSVTSIPCDALHKRQESRLQELFFETH
ncbi:AMP-binding protein [Rosenbergiella collisarenosi]|uniref:AMP-binding protein n=1 Tax=Rosenbergiella collisarenosi TaxID=1544695 RepID=UPI001F4F82C4|nr:AMP-binding protein [Rosenbergiella collisarenosi]